MTDSSAHVCVRVGGAAGDKSRELGQQSGNRVKEVGHRIGDAVKGNP